MKSCEYTSLREEIKSYRGSAMRYDALCVTVHRNGANGEMKDTLIGNANLVNEFAVFRYVDELIFVDIQFLK